MGYRRVPYSDIFMGDVVHLRVWAGLSHISRQGYRQIAAGWLGLTLQTYRLLPTPHSSNHTTAAKRLRNEIRSAFSFVSSVGYNHGFESERNERPRYFVWVICGHMFLMIVNPKFWKVTVTSPQLVHVNSHKLVPWLQTVLISFGKPGIFSDNCKQIQDAGKLFQMRPVYEYFLHKYRSG
jgi:hypothetical protein